MVKPRAGPPLGTPAIAFANAAFKIRFSAQTVRAAVGMHNCFYVMSFALH